MALKKHDFVEIDYVGKLEDGSVFDTTVQEVAKQAGILKENMQLSSLILCLGESHILKALDDYLIGKELGEYTITLEPESAFGKKSAKLLKLIPIKLFHKEEVVPHPGLEVNIDNMFGIVRSVSGGRVIVDFNHPLSGRKVNYLVTVKRVVIDPLEKVKAIFRTEFQTDLKTELVEGELIVHDKLADEIKKVLEKRVKELVPEIKKVTLKIEHS